MNYLESTFREEKVKNPCAEYGSRRCKLVQALMLVCDIMKIDKFIQIS